MKSIIWVFVGSGTGGVLRFLIAKLSHHYLKTNFPVGTLLINIIACAIIGLLMGIATERNSLNENYKLLLVAGFCGGFSTFSAFSLEAVQLWNSGQVFYFAMYISLSVLLCVAATFAGLWLMKA